jgi:hypothetical protein
MSADTWAVVGSAPSREAMSTRHTPGAELLKLSEEEMLTAKLAFSTTSSFSRSCSRKRALKLEVPQSELDTAYENAKKNVTDDVFQQSSRAGA